MRKSILFLIIAIGVTSAKAQITANTNKTTFSRTTMVTAKINAPAVKVFEILTNAQDFTNWNSTVTMLNGTIAEGEKIEIKTTLDEKRTFKLKVKEVQKPTKMVWGDSKGERVYELVEIDGVTRFTMTEKIGGLMFPMYAKYIPPFDETFEQFAKDLKVKAEN